MKYAMPIMRFQVKIKHSPNAKPAVFPTTNPANIPPNQKRYLTYAMPRKRPDLRAVCVCMCV